ncbi:MAG: diphosphate--fructose-6-phosphate 1-phosphotransferase, partial [Victivallis vadensis]
GLYDGIKSINSSSRLFGFLKGPDGLVKDEYMELTDSIIDAYRNTGGFDMIGSGRTKLETDEQFELARKHCEVLGITALVIIGGDDSNTNACMLAEYFKSHNVGIQVVGCPKTIDGDLKNEWIEASFGFDTACRVYSELIGNIGRDANSAKKYWHFIKLMGRSASHIALECALQTQPNIAIISEEVAAKKMTLAQIVEEMAVVVAARAKAGMNFGVALIPEGLIEFVPEIKVLIAELNDLLAANAAKVDAMEKADKVAFAKANLSAESAKVFGSLPTGIQMQLCNDRDPHGNVQVSLIETEKMLAEMVGTRLKQMKSEGAYDGKFSTQVHFFGYEGRCAAPSNYDADYCYSLGYNAAALIGAGKTGYMSSVRNTMLPASKWIAGGIPITMMMNIERRHGHDKPVIKKALVELDGAPFKFFAAHRAEWAKETAYVYPGPIQYFGPAEVCDLVTRTLELEQGK